MIEVKNVEKNYKQGFSRVNAVKGVSLTIEEGERVYVQGPSGAGKSTLMHILGGMDKPGKGQVLFRGKNLYKGSDRRRSRLRNRCFGFVFQFYYLLPELNVLENVMLPGLIKGTFPDKVKKKALELLGIVSMDHRLKHRPMQLSGGEAQRVTIARALINSPDVLFCDEPTGNLDSTKSREIYSLVNRLSEDNGMSVVVVSHQDVDKGFFHSEYTMKDGILRKAWNFRPGEVERDGVGCMEKDLGTI